MKDFMIGSEWYEEQEAKELCRQALNKYDIDLDVSIRVATSTVIEGLNYIKTRASDIWNL